MSFFIFLIIFFVLRGATPRDQRRSDIIKWLLGIYIAMAVFSAVVPYLSGFAGLALIGYGIYWLIRRSQQKQRDQENRNQQAYNDVHGYQQPSESYRQAAQQTYANPQPQTRSRILPSQANKRLKIVKAFNKKYDLSLTDEQMDRIVNSSYMSETWKREVESMTVKYNTIYEWFQGSTRYLRAYLHAFQVQEISSDIYQQEQICMNAFEQVWSYADSLKHLSLEERIRRVNDTYFTKFDNITFMIAYRFLEAHGRKHDLESLDPVHYEDATDELKKKYDDMSAGMPGGMH